MSLEFDPTKIYYLPNVFSPNNDGINDVLEISVPETFSIKIEEFTVFDRWGNTIFTSNDINGSWNGQFGGKLVSEGVYVYQMIATLNVCHTVKEIKKVGDVTVLK